MKDTSTTVDNNMLMSMIALRCLDAAGAFELAPAHFDVQKFLNAGQEFRHVHRGDEEESVQHSQWHEPQILFLHRHRVEGGSHVEPGEQEPPIEHVDRR